MVAARRDVGVGGGQPDHPGAAVALRPHLARRDRPLGYQAAAPQRFRRGSEGVVSTPAAGLPKVRGFRLPLGGQLSDLGYAAGWRVVRAMPEFAARNAFEAGALYASRGGGPEQLRKNLARVLDVVPAEVPGSLIRASLASYARYWREAFRLPSMNHQVLVRRLDEASIGGEHVAAALNAGRGAILALPHSGNWDMAGLWLTNTHGRFATVAERLKPESLYERFVDYRESLGFEVLPLTGGSRPPFDILTERLRGNGLVCLMSDRDLTKSGVRVNLFGEPTMLPAGPAKLALATGAALLPAHSHFEPDVAVTSISPRLDTSSGDVTTITQMLADQFGTNIAAHPADWHMMQPQWVADLSEERRARLGAGAFAPGADERSGSDVDGVGGQT
ncbi:phosphatidylinositol mannoside acyltransferase [Mycobacterium hodleri]|uniref:Phosphatidylinositol mannoside acyltransferase n=1 Tax=Mycolicibacterium hodleri TaxID=49897 RepID=A0A502E1P2_9MYCO|nr:phosphatidylinositol mannoside acyltransferase [Mycolicibacterium hodleri]